MSADVEGCGCSKVFASLTFGTDVDVDAAAGAAALSEASSVGRFLFFFFAIFVAI